MLRGLKWAALCLGACAVILLCAGATWIYAVIPPYPDNSSGARRGDGQDFADIERGRYLVTVADCAACHDEPGGAPFAGCRAIKTAFGNVVAPNITPDAETGIGTWSDAER